MPDATGVTVWSSTAIDRLLQGRNPDGAWGYHDGAASATEPTALAVLALAGQAGTEEVLPPALDWLIARQLPCGCFTASATHDQPSWATSLAAVALRRSGRADLAAQADAALLAAKVTTLPNVPDVYGYDSMIPGWPWTPGDFSLTEPTALTMIELKQAGYRAHTRVRQGADMLRDRALAAGGWNYGEPNVLGSDLYPTLVPTALALLALADEPDASTAAAVAWLVTQRGQISTLFSLGWAAIALHVLGMLNDDWRGDVVSLWNASSAERRGPLETALCLLALRDTAGHPLAVSG